MPNQPPKSRPEPGPEPKPSGGANPPGAPSPYGNQWGKSGKQNPDKEELDRMTPPRPPA